MRIVFYSYLMLSIGCCSDEQIFETETVRVGETIQLTCTRKSVGTLYWMKLVSGNFPKILGQSFRFQSFDQRIRTATEPETFVLYITKAEQSDTGAYFCMKTGQDLEFLKGTFLKVKGRQPAFTIAPSSDSVHQEHSGNLQCSALHDFHKKTCPSVDSVICLNAKSHKSHPSCNHTHLNGGDEYEKNSEELSTKKFFYIYFRNSSSSDSQTCSCAVAACVASSSGDGDTEAVNKSDPKNNMILYLLCAALAISLIVIVSLIYSIKKLTGKLFVDCDVDNTAAVSLRTNAISIGDQRSPQTDEDSVFYAAPTFKKGRKLGMRDPKLSETIYTDVRTLGLD